MSMKSINSDIEVYCPNCRKWQTVEITTAVNNWEEAEEEKKENGRCPECQIQIVRKTSYS